MLPFQLSFVQEADVMGLVLMSLEKYYNDIDKSDMLNIHKNLMVKNKIK